MSVILHPEEIKTRWLEEYRGSTKSMYGNALSKFSRWLAERDDEICSIEKLVDYMYENYRNEVNGSSIIDEYLRDPIHRDRGEAIMKNIMAAIKSYFSFRHIHLEIKFPKNKYHKSDSERNITLVELRKMCDVASIMERAILLVLFHRGLDKSTFAEEFNRKALKQMVEEFGGEDFRKWDLSKCPIPITLRRVKTEYTHVGFLERDAVKAIKEYLQLKENMKKNKKNHENIQDEYLFISSHGKPINGNMIYEMFVKIAKKAGMHQKIDQWCYKFSPHELRSLCKTTLKENGTERDVAELAIGHKIDSYDKPSRKYMRVEYKKAANDLNIMTNKPIESDSESDNSQSVTVESQKEPMQTPNTNSQNSAYMQNNQNKEREYECAECQVIHEKAECPKCGSTTRKVWNG